MGQAQVRPDHPVGVVGDPNYVGSLATVVASWVTAVVFIKWCVAGPPFGAAISSPVLLAAMRALLGLLVIAIVRMRPAAVVVAWAVSLAIAVHGGMHWVMTGHSSPYAIWEIVIPAAYVIFLPVNMWMRPDWLRGQRPRSVTLSPVEPRRSQVLSTRPVGAEPYGTGLANKVADLLERGTAVIQHGTKEYGGTGLRYVDGKYVYDDVFDGELACLRKSPPAFDRALAVFSSREAFTSWLALQSDQSLSGRDLPDPFFWNNQRITRGRLEQLVTVARVTGQFDVLPVPATSPGVQRS
jgi:hypothetical protein